jgi:TolB protein
LKLRLAVLLFVSCVLSFAEREAVLKQIDLPHPYYFRELYLPQLTTGPSAAAWSPDSYSLVYSMAGSLWRQELRSAKAEQLTAGPGYDYQPDWSADGRWVVFARYDHDAVELWSLDLRDGQTRKMTSGGAVNVEPRFSPDGKRLAFVSTTYKGHFHIFVARFDEGSLKDVEQLTPEHISPLPRYYYSQADHEISPVWTRDGAEILFVSNRGHIYGTGGFWMIKAEPGRDPGEEYREVHYEETNWKARPDFSPDGKRLVYASYLGQAWHQLWVMPARGGDAFPISYGTFDNINPRWSPDGSKIAFISNRNGNTSLWVQTIPGGDQTEVVAHERKYLQPTGRISLRVQDELGNAVAARVFVTAADGLAHAPDDAWMHADDSFDRAERPFEAHYFDTPGTSEITVPAGDVEVDVMRGLEDHFEQHKVTVPAGSTTPLTVRISPLSTKATANWVSGDVHVHMNYAGTYRNTPAHLMVEAAAENLTIVEDLVVNKEQRIPDMAYFSPQLDPASTADRLLLHGQEFHTSYWGHLGLLNLTRHFILPGYAAYPDTAAASLYPANANVADMAHEQGALVGYVHPFDSLPDPATKDPLTSELPADVALGKVDYIEVLGFSDHKSTAEVWYKLLNCGFRLPTAAGTDFMGNYASLRGPVGLNRVYAQIPAEVPNRPLTIGPWLAAIKAGRTFATNGPILQFSLGGQAIGGEVSLGSKQEVRFSAEMFSIVPLDHLQIVCNGQVARELAMDRERTSAHVDGSIAVGASGWCVLRGFSDKAEYPILDSYPYATTSPIYLSLAGAPARNPADATYFVAWMDRLISAVLSNTWWNTEAEKQSVLGMLQEARTEYESREK